MISFLQELYAILHSPQPCDTCNYRQETLDPYGCWKEASTTGWFGRRMRWLFGCEAWREK